ncbi:MAG: N-acetylglucosamine kinase, partial [Polaribacter sp.]|nr:N-acetylglucosamine kinase [Polaribacter sp.]
AHYFRDILEEIAENNNLKVTDVVQRPIDKLLEYHKNNIH